MKEIEITLPQEIQNLLERTIFELDGIDPHALNKYLFYMPEVIRIFGLAIAQLKANKREIEREVAQRESEIILEITNAIDSQKYKNEQARTAKVWMDEVYRGKIAERDDTDSEIDRLMEEVYKYRNLLQSLDNISKLRISERKY